MTSDDFDVIWNDGNVVSFAKLYKSRRLLITLSLLTFI